MCELGYVGQLLFNDRNILVLDQQGIYPYQPWTLLTCDMLSQSVRLVWDNLIVMCGLGYVGMSISSCVTTKTFWYLDIGP